jgi:hypothetical protein
MYLFDERRNEISPTRSKKTSKADSDTYWVSVWSMSTVLYVVPGSYLSWVSYIMIRALPYKFVITSHRRNWTIRCKINSDFVVESSFSRFLLQNDLKRKSESKTRKQNNIIENLKKTTSTSDNSNNDVT